MYFMICQIKKELLCVDFSEWQADGLRSFFVALSLVDFFVTPEKTIACVDHCSLQHFCSHKESKKKREKKFFTFQTTPEIPWSFVFFNCARV